MKTYQRLSLLVLVVLIAGGWALEKFDDPGVGMVDAAEKFLKLLSEKQTARTLLAYDTPKRVGWHFIPKDQRKGLQIREMTKPQRKAALALLRSALSQAGYDKSTTIMQLEAILHELEKPGGRWTRDPQRYYFTIFGKPTANSRWGLSIEGHHLSLNFVVDGGKMIASTPTFLGANPGLVRANHGVGPKKGTRVLAAEEEFGFRLVNSLAKPQLKKALIADKAPADIRNAGSIHPPTTPAVGLAAAGMNENQLTTLRSLIYSYIKIMPKAIAQQRFKALDDAGFGKIYFAWSGAIAPGIGHYYRVQGPTFLIEFCNVQSDAAGNVANHIHQVWRDMRGDFALPIKK